MTAEKEPNRWESAARKRLEHLEERILQTQPRLPAQFWQLRSEIYSVLEEAALYKRLNCEFRKIKPQLKYCEPDKEGVGWIAGGDRHDSWEGTNQIERNDGARFNFQVNLGYPALNKSQTGPEIISYHFNLVFPPQRQHMYVRFDMNKAEFLKTGNRDAICSPLLCHAHTGGGRMTAPTPILLPQEILDILLGDHLQ